MTKTVCFHCGEFKFGAFNSCRLCKRGPETDYELVMSLALTDHYFDLATLKAMGRDIKSGKPLHLEEKTRENLLTALAAMKEKTEIKFDKSARNSSHRKIRKKEDNVDLNIKKIIFPVIVVTVIFLTLYYFAYPYRSYSECLHKEIQAGGTQESSENFCWEVLDQDNLRNYGLNPLKGDFVLYNIFSNKPGAVSAGDDGAELNEAIATEGTANDTMTMEDVSNEAMAAVEDATTASAY